MYNIKSATLDIAEGSGVIRRLDDLGRIVLPKAERMYLRAKEDTPIEILRAADGSGRPYLMLKVYDELADNLNWRHAVTRMMDAMQTTADGIVMFSVRTKSGAEYGHSFLEAPEMYEIISQRVKDLPVVNSLAKLEVMQEHVITEDCEAFLAWLPIYAKRNGALLGTIFAYGEKKAVEKSYPALKMAGSALSAW